MIGRNRAIAAWSVTVAYAGALAVASLLPSGTGALRGWDAALSPTLQNVLHVPAYAALVILASLAVSVSPRTGRSGILWVALACGVFGAGLESAQAGIPGRMASALDVMLNTAGVAAGALTLLLCGARGPWRHPLSKARNEAETAS